MGSKKTPLNKGRKKYAPEAETPRPPGTEKPVTPAVEEDLLLLLAQRTQARRKAGRYLDDWIRRFVRG